MTTVKSAKTIQGKSRNHQVTDLGNDRFAVTSGHSGETYTVVLRSDGGAFCTCPWGQRRKVVDGQRSGCSHVVAVYEHCQRQAGRRVSAWSDEAQARRQHRPLITIGDGMFLTSRAA